MHSTRKLNLFAIVLALCSCTWTHADTGPRAAETAASAGEMLVQRGRAFHRVASGETLYGISRAYSIAMNEVIAANDLRQPYTLQIGQRLRLPKGGQHQVARGDTLFSIAQDNGVTVADMAAFNGIGPPYTIRVGQQLDIPPSRGGTRPASSASVAATSGGQLPPIPSTNGAAFVWPLDGRVVSTFGAKSDGRRNDGVNIAAPGGTPVRAAQNGVVVYADDSIRGLGNLILIKHQGGIITAYGHNEAHLVARGDAVARGQVIARVGATGRVGSPQLHFQIRRSGTAVDPVRYIGEQ